MQYLDDALMEYANTDIYPFHMPGHKRQEIPFLDPRRMDATGQESPFSNPCRVDITEIDGFDNLHHAEGILKEAQERAAALYGTDRCFYHVNGSTCGILAAICAATKKRDKVLVARNSHKAVYHALYLNELTAEYIYPVLTENDFQGQITPEQVERALSGQPDITAVIVTSPTYEGIISDIGGIAEVSHAHGVPLIVDSAHGAHLGFGHGFSENAVRLGADAVIMSLHKTLPSFTQTALLHIQSDRILETDIERYLGIFETSSPSYLFMAGMDACIRLLTEQREGLFSNYRELLDNFYQETADLCHIHVMTAADLKKGEAYGWDDSKIVIFTGAAEMTEREKKTNESEVTGTTEMTGAAGMTGEQLHRILLDRYHLQMEMASGSYVLGMTSIMDTKEGFDRLSEALHEIDRELSGSQGADRQVSQICEEESGAASQICEEAVGAESRRACLTCGKNSGAGFTRRMYAKNQREMQIYQAQDLPSGEVTFEEAVGKMSAGYIFLYPPGIPLIVPGEIISREFIEKIRECVKKGLRIEGVANLSSERIKIVYF